MYASSRPETVSLDVCLEKSRDTRVHTYAEARSQFRLAWTGKSDAPQAGVVHLL